MNKLFSTILFLVFIIVHSSYAQDKSVSYLNFKETKQLIKNNVDSAYIEIQFFKNIPSQYNFLLGYYFFKEKKDYAKSKNYLLVSIENNDNSKAPEYLEAYYYLGDAYRRLGIFDSAQYFYNEVIIEEINNKTVLTAKATGGLGVIFRQKNMIDSAIHYIKLANIEYTKQKDTMGLARMQNTLANLYRNFDVTLSIKHYNKALDFYQKVKNERNVAVIKQNLGLIFTDIQKYELALEYLESANLYFTKNNYLHYQIISLNNIGFTFLNIKRYTEAEQTLLKAIELNSTFKNALAYSHLNLGTLYNIEERFSKAYKHLIIALSIAKENNLEHLLLEIYINLISNKKVQESTKDFDNYFNEYNKLQKKVQDESIQAALAEFQNELHDKEIKNKLALAIKDKKHREHEIENHKRNIYSKNIIIGFGFFIIILLIILIFTIYRSGKKQKRLNLGISSRNTIIEQQNKELEETVEERTIELIAAKEKTLQVM